MAQKRQFSLWLGVDLFPAICAMFHKQLLMDEGFAFTPFRSFVAATG
jgi:hypothetical protein